MLGILFIYWIWKAFTNLALQYNKNKWTYFIIGLAAYYGSTMISGFAAGMLVVLVNGVANVTENSFNNAGWNILFVLCGILVCYGTYKLLERKAIKEWAVSKKEGIESIGVTDEN
ncbi:hypothetical protein [Flavobacterium hungaricum]|uniref:Uncharacterized protein n=1 Tax=Flavobacterium hungaricum TaxID=2082725 RepID=A0ABR9TQC7_9FLAO|nr:hypothetical protein [Flavobacterium hungaricum]MBE8727212.1 hypothetical protein [Flavobacterium hungaricum]